MTSRYQVMNLSSSQTWSLRKPYKFLLTKILLTIDISQDYMDLVELLRVATKRELFLFNKQVTSTNKLMV